MFGEYAEFIIPSYAISALVMAALVLWSWLDYRARLRELAELEKRGVQRRSQASGNDRQARQ
jgi:heme exporter protein D